MSFSSKPQDGGGTGERVSDAPQQASAPNQPRYSALESAAVSVGSALHHVADSAAHTLHHAADAALHKVQDVGDKVMSGIADVAVVTAATVTGPGVLLDGLSGGPSGQQQERREMEESYTAAKRELRGEHDLQEGDLTLDRVERGYHPPPHQGASGPATTVPFHPNNTPFGTDSAAQEVVGGVGGRCMDTDPPSRVRPALLHDVRSAPVPTYGGPPVPAVTVTGMGGGRDDETGGGGKGGHSYDAGSADSGECLGVVPGNLENVQAAPIPMYGGPPVYIPPPAEVTRPKVPAVTSVSTVTEAPLTGIHVSVGPAGTRDIHPDAPASTGQPAPHGVGAAVAAAVSAVLGRDSHGTSAHPNHHDEKYRHGYAGFLLDSAASEPSTTAAATAPPATSDLVEAPLPSLAPGPVTPKLPHPLHSHHNQQQKEEDCAEASGHQAAALGKGAATHAGNAPQSKL